MLPITLVMKTMTMFRNVPGVAFTHRFRRDDGALAIEYAIIAVVIALGLLAAAFAARDQIIAMLQQIVAADLQSAPSE